MQIPRSGHRPDWLADRPSRARVEYLDLLLPDLNEDSTAIRLEDCSPFQYPQVLPVVNEWADRLRAFCVPGTSFPGVKSFLLMLFCGFSLYREDQSSVSAEYCPSVKVDVRL